ncbi:MAG: transcriptional antiterminator [Desulfobacterales bacterium]|nr:transcriptional antiterminator [Desulfobacterales bacterium]
MMIQTPLFPGYLFVKTDLHPVRHLEILKTAGAVRLIGTREGPVSVPEEIITSLKIMVDAEGQVTTGRRLKKGDKVIVAAGPFAGVIGVFVRYRGKERVVVNVDALGRCASVNVRVEDIEPLPQILS